VTGQLSALTTVDFEIAADRLEGSDVCINAIIRALDPVLTWNSSNIGESVLS
jgi:hypothetical protein